LQFNPEESNRNVEKLNFFLKGKLRNDSCHEARGGSWREGEKDMIYNGEKLT
jgi:hypothetical protein